MFAGLMPIVVVAVYELGPWSLLMIGIIALIGLFLTRRIDLDTEGISYVPLLPLSRKQTFRWSEIGPFERSTKRRYRGSKDTVLEAPILSGARMRFWGSRSSKLILMTNYGTSPLGRGMDADAVLQLVASYRARAEEQS